MTRKVISGITLLAFVNCLMGCVVTSVDKVPAQSSETIGPSEKIAHIVLLDGTTVNFDQRGGTFGSVPHQVIKGVTLAGDTAYLPLSNIWICRTSSPENASPTDIDTSHIFEVVLNDNSLVMFQPPGGVYDTKAGEITGMHALRGKVSYKLNTLRSIRIHRPTAIRLDSLRQHPEQRVYEVIDKTYNVFTYNSDGGYITSVPSGFSGWSPDGKYIVMPADNVLYAGVERTDAASSVLASLGVVVGGLAVIVLIAAATKQCCPFIYAYDGKQYVFDAEPLGGAICPGLARTDISRLDFAKPVDGEYRLLVRNEVPETQYIDRMTMLLVDHPPTTAVYPDLQGKFYAFKKVMGATSAWDEKGMSLMNFLQASDKVMWQTNLPAASRDTSQATRHEITVTLPKPAGARTAWLVTNIGTSSWGSNMIRKTVEYRGSTAQAWLASLTPGSQPLQEMNQFLEREEMYHLKTWMQDGASWKQATTILGQGPFVNEDRVYPIDVSHVTGNSLVLRFQPPKGFWTFDYIGVSYDEPTVIAPLPVSATKAEDQHGVSLVDRLSQTDSLHYAMPEVGDYANIRFSAPAVKVGMTRAVYLATSGYYELHMKKELPDQFARLYSIGMNPGQIVKTMMEEYRAWQAQQVAQQQSQSQSH